MHVRCCRMVMPASSSNLALFSVWRVLNIQKQQRYRDGSAIWRMGELAAPLEGIQEAAGIVPLETTQLQMMHLLQMNKDRINDQEKGVLEELEARYRLQHSVHSDSFFSAHSASALPVFNEADLNQVKGGGHLSLPGTASVKKEDGNENEAFTSPSTIKCEEPDQDVAITSTSDLPSTFSLQSRLHVPLDICSSELVEMCSRRVDRPLEFKPIFEERVPPPQPPEIPTVDIKIRLDFLFLQPSVSVHPTPLLRPTPLVVVESRKDAQSSELQRLP
uniref:Unconventional myosin-Va n=1 Tax=Heterorhabditis bacteriophora TaxID=37862 RepID=A0A1I7WPQ4_HETBA